MLVVPEWVVRSIVPETMPPKLRVLDPCVGRGEILQAMGWPESAWGYDTSLSQISEVRARYKTARKLKKDPKRFLERDALASTPWTNKEGERANLIIMNPPHETAMAFIERALKEVHQGEGPHGTVAALLELTFLAGDGRRAFHKAHPCDVMVVGDMHDHIARAWFVWNPGRGGRWSVIDPVLTPDEARAKLNGRS